METADSTQQEDLFWCITEVTADISAAETALLPYIRQCTREYEDGRSLQKLAIKFSNPPFSRRYQIIKSGFSGIAWACFEIDANNRPINVAYERRFDGADVWQLTDKPKIVFHRTLEEALAVTGQTAKSLREYVNLFRQIVERTAVHTANPHRSDIIVRERRADYKLAAD